MARILAAGTAAGGDTLKGFMCLAIDDPMKVAGLLHAIKVPTPESQQLQLEQIQTQLNLQHHQ